MNVPHSQTRSFLAIASVRVCKRDRNTDLWSVVLFLQFPLRHTFTSPTHGILTDGVWQGDNAAMIVYNSVEKLRGEVAAMGKMVFGLAVIVVVVELGWRGMDGNWTLDNASDIQGIPMRAGSREKKHQDAGLTCQQSQRKGTLEKKNEKWNFRFFCVSHFIACSTGLRKTEAWS